MNDETLYTVSCSHNRFSPYVRRIPYASRVTRAPVFQSVAVLVMEARHSKHNCKPKADEVLDRILSVHL